MLLSTSATPFQQLPQEDELHAAVAEYRSQLATVEKLLAEDPGSAEVREVRVHERKSKEAAQKRQGRATRALPIATLTTQP